MEYAEKDLLKMVEIAVLGHFSNGKQDRVYSKKDLVTSLQSSGWATHDSIEKTLNSLVCMNTLAVNEKGYSLKNKPYSGIIAG